MFTESRDISVETFNLGGHELLNTVPARSNTFLHTLQIKMAGREMKPSLVHLQGFPCVSE